MMKIIVLFSLIIFTLLQIKKSDQLIAYDCTSPKTTVTELSLVDTPECSLKTRNITTREVYVQLIQPEVFKEVKYQQCLIEIEHIIYKCGVFVDTIDSSGYYYELLQLGRSDCLSLHKDRVLRYNGISLILPRGSDRHHISIETIGSISDGKCTAGPTTIINGIKYEKPVRISKFSIKLTTGKATVDLEEAKLITEEGARCNYHEYECLTSLGGNTYWENYNENNNCQKEKHIAIYEGSATEIIETFKEKETVSYILHYQNYDFQIITTGKVYHACGAKALQTEHPKLSVILKEKDLPFVLTYNKKQLGKNINLMTYINSKLVYTIKHIQNQIEKIYDQFSYDKCVLESKLIHNILASAILSPHEFAYQYFEKEGYTASLRGEVVYLLKCNAVSVNYTTLSPDECYNEIPVKKDGALMFISPRGRLLSKIGTKIECSTILPVKFKVLDSWYVISPHGLIQTSSPSTMEISSNQDWVFEEINNYATAGIYTQEDLDKIDKIILASVRNEAIKNQISRAVVGDSKLSNGLTVENMMTFEDLEKFGKTKWDSFLDRVYSSLGRFGNFVSTLIGCIIVIKGFLFLINSLISFKILKDVFGLSWQLIFFWWEHLVHILIKERDTVNKSSNIVKTKSDEIIYRNRTKKEESKCVLDMESFL